MKSLQRFGFILAMLSGFSPGAFGERPAADLILRNGKVVTVDADFSIQEAIAIKGDRVMAVGADSEIVELKGPATRMIELDGRTVIPGLIDSHIHADGYGLHITRHVMFSTGERLTVAEMLSKIKQHAAKTPPGEWIYVRGPYSLDFVAEGRLPNRSELDSVAPDNPLFMNMQGHVGVVNSRAIEIAGVTRNTPDPPNSVIVRNPQTGELTGTLYEFPAFTPFLKHYPGYSMEERLEAIRSANRVFTTLGLSTVVNLWTPKENLDALQQLARSGDLHVRWATVLKLAPEDFRDKSYTEVEEELLQQWPSSRAEGNWLTVNGIKIIFDGFAEAAYMHQPYLEEQFGAGWHGVAFWDRDSLTHVLQACANHNIQAFVHVAGDAALDAVLEVMTTVNEKTPISGRRWTLEHANVMPTKENLRTAKKLQLVISTQQAMGWSIGKTFKSFWGRQRGAIFAPNRTWLEHLGHPYLKAGSDNRPIDPFIGFWAYLAREDVDGQISTPDEGLPREDVLRLYTINGAYGIFEEDDRGSLEKGKLADLVVLSKDILTVPESEVRAIQPVMTLIGGEITYPLDTEESDAGVHGR